MKVFNNLTGKRHFKLNNDHPINGLAKNQSCLHCKKFHFFLITPYVTKHICTLAFRGFQRFQFFRGFRLQRVQFAKGYSFPSLYCICSIRVMKDINYQCTVSSCVQFLNYIKCARLGWCFAILKGSQWKIIFTIIEKNILM
jgi:hypothetical protein